MADNVTANAGSGGAVFKTDEVAGVHTPVSKMAFGADGTVTTVDSVNPLPVTTGGLTDTQLRATPVPTSVSGSVAVTGTFYPATQPVSGTVTANTGLSQPLTDTQLRATAVPVSAAALPLPSGAATSAKQDTLATAVGTLLTNTQLRASAVPVSAASLPLPTGAATETTLSSLNTKTPALGQALMATSQPVVIASNQTGVPVTGTFWQTTQPISGNVGLSTGTNTIGGVNLTQYTPASGRLPVDGSGVTQPVSVAQTVSIQETATSVIKNASGIVKTGAGVLSGILVTASSSGVIRFYNGTSTGGELLNESLSVVAGNSYPMPRACGTGIYFELVSGSATITVYYT